ncbi:hypothetical protein [Azospirillum largimobile]
MSSVVAAHAPSPTLPRFAGEGALREAAAVPSTAKGGGGLGRGQ